MVLTAVFSTRTVGLPWVRCTTSPYTVQLRRGLFLLCLPWLCLDIGTRLHRSARPTPLYHVAGSLFATHTGLSHASSRPVISDDAFTLLMLSFRPERRTVFICLLVLSHQECGTYTMPGTPTFQKTSLFFGSYFCSTLKTKTSPPGRRARSKADNRF